MKLSLDACALRLYSLVGVAAISVIADLASVSTKEAPLASGVEASEGVLDPSSSFSSSYFWLFETVMIFSKALILAALPAVLAHGDEHHQAPLQPDMAHVVST